MYNVIMWCVRAIFTLHRLSSEFDNTSLDKKVKFTLEQAMKAQRGSRGIALLFL